MKLTTHLHRRRSVTVAVLSVLVAVLTGLFAAPAGAVQITEFPLPPGSGPQYITAGSDGYMWFTDYKNNTIGRIGMSGEVTQYSLGLTPNAGPLDITPGPEGNLFFTEINARKIGRITPSGAITEFSSGLSAEADVWGITTGPENNLWFTETNGRLGILNPLTGAISEFAAGGVNTAITNGPGGNLWFTVPDQSAIYRTTPAGQLNSYGPLSGSDCAVGAESPCPFPNNIAVGSEGNLWASESRGNAIVRVTPSGAISEFSDGLTRGAAAAGLAAGPEGNMWFTEIEADQVGRITPTGVITEFHEGLTKEAEPTGIALGPDHNLWVTESAKDRIARIIPDVPPIVATGAANNIARTHAIVTGTVRSRGNDTHYFFQYGPAGTYATGTAQVDNGSGDNTITVSTEVKGLTPGTAYQFRVVAQNAFGTGIGSDGTFTTAPEPAHPKKKKKKHHHKKKPKLTVKPFQMYFAGRSLGRHQLLLRQIIILGLKHGEKVSFKCTGCGGGPQKAHRRTSSARLAFPVRLKVSARSRMRIKVAAKHGGSRVKLYGVRISPPESKVKRETCFASGKKHKPISCAAVSEQSGKKKHHHKKKR